MAGVHRVRRLLVPAALTTTLAAAMFSGAATAGATGATPQPSWTAAFRATSTAIPAVQLADDGELPSTEVRRAALHRAVAPVTPHPRIPVQHRAAARPATAAVHRPAAARHASSSSPRTSPASRHASSPSGSSALERAVARIPGYASHRPATWISTSRYGHYGATDLAGNTIYINPDVPASKLDSVVRHEWSHILSVRAYGGSYTAMMAATDRVFGGSGMAGAERAADCMAIQLGATWTNYTSCSNSAWRAGASTLLSGRRL